MKKQMRKLVSLMLATVMVITMLPLTAFAETVLESDVSVTDISGTDISYADINFPLETESIKEEPDASVPEKENCTASVTDKELMSDTESYDEIIISTSDEKISKTDFWQSEETRLGASSGKCGDNLTYTYEDGLLTIAGNGSMWDWDITNDFEPPWFGWINGVTPGNDKITKIVIGEGVTTIGREAFVGCMNLVEVSIPNSVTAINADAFWTCKKLKEIAIPENVEYIGTTAFGFCEAITHITISGSVRKIDSGAFSDCTSLSNVVISDGVLSIGANAFAGCAELTSIRIPDTIEEIGDYSFYQCYNLEHVVISKKMTNIPDYAFAYDDNILTVFIPQEVTSISDCAFEGCGESSKLIIYGYKYSSAENYASKHDNITFVDVNANFLFSASPSNSCLAGSTVSLTASGGTAYKFYYECNGTWVRLQDTGSENTCKWKPTVAGKYNLYCDISTAEGALICKIIPYTVNIDGSISVSPVEGIRADSPVTLTASGGNTYKFYYNYGNSWVRIQDTSEKNTCSWIPPKPGTYTIYCDIKASGGLSACEKINVTVGESEKYTAYLKCSLSSPRTAGMTIKLTASATGGKGALKYKFYSECNGVWTKLWDYDTRDTYNWHATTVGTHTVYCDVMDEEGNVACAVVKYEIVKGESFVADLNANRISGQLVGTEIRLLGGSSNGTGTVKYKFYYEIDGNWVRLADYSTQDYFLWTPTKPGYYNLYMDAQDSAGNTASKRLCITIDEGQTLKVTSVTFDPTTGKTGTSTTITAKSTGGSGTVTYKFYYEMNGSWVKLQDFSEKTTCAWTPAKAGTYHIYVDAIDGTKNTQCLMVNYTVK